MPIWIRKWIASSVVLAACMVYMAVNEDDIIIHVNDGTFYSVMVISYILITAISFVYFYKNKDR